MTKARPDSLVMGYKKYFYLHEICDYLEMNLSDTYEFFKNNSDYDWIETSKEEFLIDSMGYRSLMIDKDKDTYSYLINEMEFNYELEKIEEEELELLYKKYELEKKLESINEQRGVIAVKRSEFIISTFNID